MQYYACTQHEMDGLRAAEKQQVKALDAVVNASARFVRVANQKDWDDIDVHDAFVEMEIAHADLAEAISATKRAEFLVGASEEVPHINPPGDYPVKKRTETDADFAQRCTTWARARQTNIDRENERVANALAGRRALLASIDGMESLS